MNCVVVRRGSDTRFFDVAGFCWTQLTDVEQEQNGLLTADRRPKADPTAIRAVNEAFLRA